MPAGYSNRSESPTLIEPTQSQDVFLCFLVGNILLLNWLNINLAVVSVIHDCLLACLSSTQRCLRIQLALSIYSITKHNVLLPAQQPNNQTKNNNSLLWLFLVSCPVIQLFIHVFLSAYSVWCHPITQVIYCQGRLYWKSSSQPGTQLYM